MLSFITKAQYWKLVDEGIEDLLRKGVFDWHLKSVQDTVAFSLVRDKRNQNIAEIGGGDSRILPVLAKENICTNIEKFEGQDGGPKGEISFSNVANVHAFVGEYSDLLAENSFDTIFSVSVVEHIPNDQMPAFIDDCHRILRPGGTMIHLVDMYLMPDRSHYNDSRMQIYGSSFNHLFRPMEPVTFPEDRSWPFMECYCSNPDNTMYGWNSVNPQLRQVRENSQSVAIAWAGIAQK